MSLEAKYNDIDFDLMAHEKFSDAYTLINNYYICLFQLGSFYVLANEQCQNQFKNIENLIPNKIIISDNCIFNLDSNRINCMIHEESKLDSDRDKFRGLLLNSALYGITYIINEIVNKHNENKRTYSDT
ncbi:MAG: hypothetical protein JW931_01970 [Methanomicrobiaceae archaeon]|nr:hypothetical protein [Methanomicrobiaceae archaeon]